MMTRAEALRKSITVFEAIRRMASKGNAGLEPERGAEEEYSTVEECVRVMKEWLREMESGAFYKEVKPLPQEVIEKLRNGSWNASDDWSNMLQGNPLITEETIEAARRTDEARDRMIKQLTQPEPDVPKVVDLREWQRITAEKPPERMDFDEEP